MSLKSPVLDKVGLQLPFVEAELNYLVPMTERLVNYMFEPPPDVPRHNGSYDIHQLPIHNARAIAPNLSLDQEGFALAAHTSQVEDFYNDEEVRRVYYPEAEQLLVQLTGGFKAVVFDHNVRNIQRAQQGESNAKEPVKRVHNDFTARSGYSRARTELAARGIENAEALLQQRFAVINVWRPITGPVQASPLAVCDASSIASTDWVAGDLVYRDRVGETYAVTYNPSHRWFYFPQLQSNEAILIKCFDSAEDGRARFTAHTAFDDPTTPLNAPPRESIELRSFVFYR
jgi:hypothetical protein